ncbi:uncharacterized protein LOC128962759 [Oppia nitens]|uniref:uncharacterized protein LOC128962759 n=1 Tax=Oppia nitens TaxID=1686743 RepID=UPI0023DB4801|nr:uncharacterized protein LOC128962759 [Oppia nitens]
MMDSSIIDDALTKFVRIIVFNTDIWLACQEVYTGTACVVDVQPNGRTVFTTCAHVTRQSNSCFIIDHQNNNIGVGQVLYSEPQHDLALIVFSNVSNVDLKVTDVSIADFGDPVLTIGVPSTYHEQYDWFPGSIQCPASLLSTDAMPVYIQHYKTVDQPMMHTSAEMISGMSGGPVLNTSGQLVGYSCCINAARRYFFAGTANEIKSFYERANQYSVGQVDVRLQQHTMLMGLQLQFRTIRANLNIINYTVAVPTVGNEQLMFNDDIDGTIVEINGQPVQSLRQFLDIIRQSSGDNQVTVRSINRRLRNDFNRHIWVDNQINAFSLI